MSDPKPERCHYCDRAEHAANLARLDYATIRQTLSRILDLCHRLKLHLQEEAKLDLTQAQVTLDQEPRQSPPKVGRPAV